MPGPDAHVLGRVRIPARALVLSCGLWSSCASSMAHAPLMLCMMWCDCRAPVVRVACKVAWCVRARSRELSFDREDDRQDSTPTGHRLHLGSALSAWLLGRGFGDRQFWWIAPIASSVGRLGPGRRVRSCHFQVPARPHITHQTTSHSVRAVVLYFLFHSESETSVRKHAHPTHIICESSNET